MIHVLLLAGSISINHGSHARLAAADQGTKGSPSHQKVADSSDRGTVADNTDPGTKEKKAKKAKKADTDKAADEGTKGKN
jgi:hypothetical protein